VIHTTGPQNIRYSPAKGSIRGRLPRPETSSWVLLSSVAAAGVVFASSQPSIDSSADSWSVAGRSFARSASRARFFAFHVPTSGSPSLSLLLFSLGSGWVDGPAGAVGWSELPSSSKRVCVDFGPEEEAKFAGDIAEDKACLMNRFAILPSTTRVPAHDYHLVMCC
jgi:hypothetical protein